MISEELERGRRKNQESERGLGVVFMKKNDPVSIYNIVRSCYLFTTLIYNFKFK
jgi:hypothetical protein